MNATWRVLITDEMLCRGESWSDVLKCTLSDSQLDTVFDAGYGSAEGEPFTLWTHNRVYFPVDYDGSETVASVLRNPCDKKTKHVGGRDTWLGEESPELD